MEIESPTIKTLGSADLLNKDFTGNADMAAIKPIFLLNFLLDSTTIKS